MRFPAFPILVVAICYLGFAKCDVDLVAKPTPYMIHITRRYPVVPGAFKCGGHSEFRELRYSGCVDTDVWCKVDADAGITAEMDYLPLRDMETLWMRIRTGIDDDAMNIVYEGPIPHSSVKRNSKYMISVTAPIDHKLRGSRLTGRYVIYDPSDWSLRLCVQAEVEVI